MHERSRLIIGFTLVLCFKWHWRHFSG